MGRIISLHGGGCREVQDLLPWYVTGRLEPAELDAVDAHLGTCEACQAELRLQRRLAAEIADLPVDAEHSWLMMQGRLDDEPRRRPVARRGEGWSWRATGPWLGWAAAAVLVLANGVVLFGAGSPAAARYHALGAAPETPAANAVVIFRPDTTERDLRQTLVASHARLVDGPTASDAYVLHVPPAERTAILAKLRGQADVVVAEPIDSAAGP